MYRYLLNNANFISIHAPRGGSDISPQVPRKVTIAISIHAPRGGSDMLTIVFGSPGADFNPRSPRGERRRCMCAPERRNFNPRSPRGERRTRPSFAILSSVFQSTLPAGGATPLCLNCFPVQDVFQSTLPAGGATRQQSLKWYAENISIHAPRGGSDDGYWHLDNAKDRFQSTLPAGGATLFPLPGGPTGWTFQSTLPAGGATTKGDV